MGKRIRLPGPQARWLTVAGVVSDVRYREWEAARPDFYVPCTQRAQHRSDFVVKTRGDAAALAATVRREIFAIDKQQPISNVTTMEALVDRAIARSRFIGIALAALLAQDALAQTNPWEIPKPDTYKGSMELQRREQQQSQQNNQSQNAPAYAPAPNNNIGANQAASTSRFPPQALRRIGDTPPAWKR